jgi:tripartite-type tricarboxylate transporter receptor subunit TctC
VPPEKNNQKLSRRKLLVLRYAARILSVSMLVATAGATFGQDNYPVKAVRIITAEVGGNNDWIARLIAQELTRSLGQPVVVENRGGIAPEIVAKAPPDGHTLLFYGGAAWLAPFLHPVSYDPVKDLAPITLVITSPNVLVVHPSLPLKSVKDLIALAKARPGVLNYGAGTVGAAPHLGMEMFKNLAQVDMLHVPYKGSSPMLTDLIGGRGLVGFDNVLSALPYISASQLRAIASSAAQRTSNLPTIPTIAESGLSGFEVMVWQGVLAPAETPADVITLLNQQFISALKTPSVTERLAAMNIELFGNQPNEFAQFLKKDIAKWAEVVKKSGAQVD